MLGARLPSPTVVKEIDSAIGDLREQWSSLLALRKVAVHIHGDATPEPAMPGGDEPAAHAEPNTERKDERPELALSMSDLVSSYRTHEESGYHKLRFNTRENYKGLLRRVERDLGPEKVAEMDADRLQQQFDDWSGGGERIPMARSLLAILRILATFGSTVLKSRDCRELKLTLHDMRFERAAQGGGERLTIEHAKKIIAKAHEMGLPSVALAQAFQIDCGLKQKDVVGEWIPFDEPGEAKVIAPDQSMKWLRGLVWPEIGADAVLRHVASSSGELVEKLLTPEDTPLVVAEFKRMGSRPEGGPVIVFEKTGRPYLTHQWRRTWREVANAAGVPPTVMNRDSAG